MPTSGAGGGSAGAPPGKGGSGPTSGDAGIAVGAYNEEVVEADPAPLPIAGGTVAIIAQGTKAAVAPITIKWW
jgi:hypothetical protein